MSDASVVAPLQISSWHPALQAIVRCLEAVEASLPAYEQRHWRLPDQYRALIDSVECFLIAENKRNSWGTEALAELAIRVSEGFELIPPERAIPYLYRAADGGYLNAQLELARLADRCQIPPYDFLKTDSDQRHYDQQQWDDYNRKESEYWWKAAAENGSADAQYAMTEGLIDSDDPEQFAQGVLWLKKAALQKTPSPDAQYELAHLIESGRLKFGCPEEEWRLYEAAAKSGVPEAMLAAGRYLENGIGVDADVNTAVDWYIKAAEGGEDEGYLRAGMLSGNTSHLKKAADAGYVEAMLNLAPLALEMGTDEPRGYESFQTGLDYYERAANKDCLEAVLELAQIYSSCEWSGYYQHWWFYIAGLSEYDRMERVLGYYEQARELGWEPAAEHIERIKAVLDDLEKK